MSNLLKTLCFTFLLSFICFSATYSQSVKFPLQQGWVNDYEGLFSQQQKKELSSIITAFEKKTRKEIAIVTLNDIAPYSNMRDYSIDLSHNWSLGKDDTKKGLIIIISKSLRAVRITTAYGTEKLIRDEVCKKIINVEMLPAYASGDYFSGTKKGLLSLMQEWN